MKTSLMVILVFIVYGILGLIPLFFISGLNESEFFQLPNLTSLVVLSFFVMLIEFFRGTVFCGLFTWPKARAFLMTLLGIVVTSSTFIWVLLICTAVLSGSGVYKINDTNQTIYMIWSIIITWMLTILIYGFVFQRCIQLLTVKLLLKFNTKIFNNDPSYISEVSDIEKRYKGKALQFFNSLGTLIGIAYGWFYIGTKNSVLDVFNSSTSMLTFTFSMGILVYVSISSVLENDDLY